MSVESESGHGGPRHPDVNDTQQRLSDLRDSIDNDELDELLQSLDILVQEFKRVDAQRRQLEHRVNRLEARFPQSTKGPETNADVFDARDRRVVEIIDANDKETVTLGELQDLYRRHTDVRNPRTLKQRVKALTTAGPFEPEQNNVWRYAPDVD